MLHNRTYNWFYYILYNLALLYRPRLIVTICYNLIADFVWFQWVPHRILQCKINDKHKGNRYGNNK